MNVSNYGNQILGMAFGMVKNGMMKMELVFGMKRRYYMIMGLMGVKINMKMGVVAA